MFGIRGWLAERRRLKQQDRIRRYREADIVTLRNAVKERDRIIAEIRKEHREAVERFEYQALQREQKIELLGQEIDSNCRQIAWYQQYVEARTAEQVRILEAASGRERRMDL